MQLIDIDFDGDGTSDFSSSDPTIPVSYNYPTSGIYLATINVTDSTSTQHNQIIAINIYDTSQMDQQFTTIWNSINNALLSGNVSSATTYLNKGAKRKYQPVFEALLPYIPEIISSYSSLQRVSLRNNVAEYAINRLVNGENHIFLIYFTKDTDGVWRLDSM